MKLVLTIGAAICSLMVLSLYDLHQARNDLHQARNERAAAFRCRMPPTEGDIAVVTFSLRSGEIVAECHYATARTLIPKKGT